MRVRSKKSAERRRGTADETGSGKDLGTLQGSQILELQLISTLRGRGIQPRPMIPSPLSFPTGFSSGYRGLRNTGFARGTRSEITRRTEKERVFIRSMTA